MHDVIAIICEYNPFHMGHKYQIDTIRKQMPNSDIICIMSGNIVQRGEFAIIDKYTRAKTAVDNGANAVFELPYPYSGSTAEIFAKSAVYLANKLGATQLYFGTKDFSIEKLNSIAEIIDSTEFEELISKELKDKTKTYIKAKENALESLGYTIPKDANDILSLEYIRAIKTEKYNIKPNTIKRIGADYSDKSICEIMSASAIRNYFYENGAFISVPEISKEIYEKDNTYGKILDLDECKKYLYRAILLSNEKKLENAFDSSFSLANFIYNLAQNSDNYVDFFENLSSKNFTSSRIKRTILYSIFEINKIDAMPLFTNLLAVDSQGRKIVSKINKEMTNFIVTKMTDYKKMLKKAKKQYDINANADKIYNTFLYKPKSIKDVYKNKPYIK